MKIIYQSAQQLHISAGRGAHLEELERHAAAETQQTWKAGPLTGDCTPDPNCKTHLVWKLYPATAA